MTVKELELLVELRKRQLKKRQTMKDRVENANFNKHVASCATCRAGLDLMLEAKAFQYAGQETTDLMKTLRSGMVH